MSSSGTAGAANPSIAGGSGLDNQYVIDGVNVTNQGYGALGSYSIVFGSLGNATPFDFMQEVQVKTGGYQAEFGQATGGLVNVITKSGSNNVTGSLFGYTRPSGLESDFTPYQSINGSVQTVGARAYDAGVEGGFPIVRNRLFAFGAIDPGRDVTTFQAPQGLPALEPRQRRSRTRQPHLLGESDLAACQRASHRRVLLRGSVEGAQRSATNLGAARRQHGLVQLVDLRRTQSNDSLQWRALKRLAARRQLRARVERHRRNAVREHMARHRPDSHTRTASPAASASSKPAIAASISQYSIKSTHILGDHQVKYGFEYDDVTYSQINQRTGPTFTAPDGRQTATGAQITVLPDPTFGKIYRVTRANFNSGRTTLQKYGSLFVQDSWKVNDRLTINPGLRYEQEKLAGTIINDFTLKNNWAARLGATYDITGDSRTKLYGSYGRYYSRVPNDLAARALSADDGTSRADYFDAESDAAHSERRAGRRGYQSLPTRRA